ncbi:MAG: LapA family protein [Spirochaetes bacterium]|nr:LapA family protein [Spirochaetota bacterium]
MVHAILGALFLLGFALLILLNSAYTTNVNLFGKVYEQVSVILIILISFFTGVCFTILLYLYSKIRRFSRNRRKQKQEKLEKTIHEATKGQTIESKIPD